MNTDSISFDLGCNFDYKLFDFVDQYDKKHAITSFFGKLKHDGLPGGRTASIIPDFTFDELSDYVKECQKRDITFNYLINPLSMDQNEIDPFVGKKIREFIHTLYDMGIKAFTLNSPILIKYVKNRNCLCTEYLCRTHCDKYRQERQSSVRENIEQLVNLRISH